MPRIARLLPVLLCLILDPGVLLAYNPEPASRGLEIPRTDPAEVRSQAGQLRYTRDVVRLDDFRGNYGDAWRVRWNEFTGTAHRLFGANTPVEKLSPGMILAGKRDKANVLQLAEAVVRANPQLLGTNWESLRPVYTDFKGGRWVVTLQQTHAGMDVVGGRVDLRFSERGDLIMLGSDAYPVQLPQGEPRIGAPRARQSAMAGLTPAADPIIEEPELVLLPVLGNDPAPLGRPLDSVTFSPQDLRLRAAYRLRVRTDSPPGDWMTYVDAATGAVLWRYNRVRFAGISGDMTAEIHPLTGNDPLVTVPFPDTEVTGGAFADTVACYDFETGAQGWSGPAPWAVSAEDANSGAQAWSDSPGGSYANGISLSLTSPTLDITGVVDPSLRFHARTSLEDTWDFLYVEASGDNGSTWTTLGSLNGVFPWQAYTFSLNPVVGTSQLVVRFRIWTDGAVTDDGVWIDDVCIGSLGQDVTDGSGAYALDSTGGSSLLEAGMFGPYAQLANRAGADAQFSATAAGAAQDIHWDAGNATDAERDSYYGMLVSHARIKQIDPGFTALDFPLPAFVGIPFCNAYWAGGQIVMGSGGAGCADLGTWIPVMYHEYAHGITDNVYTPVGDPPSRLHEAFSDYFASTITNDPRVGPDILGPGTMFRTIDNKLRSPEDEGGSGHLDGTIIAGALWDMRTALLPDTALADSLYHFARYGFPYTFEDYFLEVLMVDDDNANLADGTPHETAIRSAFGFHGIGLGPEFEHVFVEVQDGAGNGDGRLDPGELADLQLTLRNFGGLESGVSAVITTNTPGVTILVDSTYIDTVAALTQTVAPTPFQVQVDGSVPVGTAIEFDLVVTSDLGVNGDCFMIPVGYVPILLVDDDRTRTFETFFGTALDNSGKGYTRWNASVLGCPSAEEMGEYRAVIWFTGNDATNSLTFQDQEELQAYLSTGGNLWMTGEDIDWDLWNNGSAADVDFHEDWLRATVVNNDINAPPVNGSVGDPIMNGLSFTLNGGTGANNLNSAGALGLINGSVTAATYTGGQIAALRYDVGHRMFYCAFGFEAIADAGDRDLLMQRAVDWLCPTEATDPTTQVAAPNGGESLLPNDAFVIEWTAFDDVAVLWVDIEVSFDNGAVWQSVVNGTENDFSYAWTVTDTTSDSCLVRVTAVDPSSNTGSDVSDAVFIIGAPLAADPSPGVTAGILHPAMPNPFRQSMRIRFDLPAATPVWLDVIAIDGRRIRSLVAGEVLAAGSAERTWDGNDDRGRVMPSGVYFLRMRTGGGLDMTRKVHRFR